MTSSSSRGKARRREARWMKPLRWLIYATVVAGAVIVVAQFTGFPAISPVTQVLSFYPWFALGWIVVAAVCFLTRQWVIAGVSGGLALIVAWTFFTTTMSSPPPAQSGDNAVTVVASNVLKGRATTELADRLVNEPVDVVLIAECTPACATELRRPRLLQHYPHQLIKDAPGPNGSAILSAWPLTPLEGIDQAEVDREGWLAMPAAVIELPSGPTTVRVAHPIPPIPGVVGAWASDLAILADFVEQETGPVILGGDFNATPYHRQFRGIISSGNLADVIPSSPGTWPTHWPSYGRIPIDHILVSPGFEVMSNTTWELTNSDHLAVVAELSKP